MHKYHPMYSMLYTAIWACAIMSSLTDPFTYNELVKLKKSKYMLKIQISVPILDKI